MKLLFAVIIMLILFILSCQEPQVFGKIETCDISFKSGNPKKKLTLPNYITAEDQDVSLHLTICGEIPKLYANGETCTNVCLFDKRTRKLMHPRNPEEAKFELEDSSENELEFKLHGDINCKDNKTYDIKIRMVSNPSLNLKKPQLIKNSCEIELEMLRPDYAPPCTYLLETGQLIDLRPLKGHNFVVPFKGEAFHVSICGSNEKCDDIDASACKIGNDSIIFGSTKYQKVEYDNLKNQLKVKSSYKNPERKKKMWIMEVIIDCDWKVPYFSNGRYIEPPKQGKTFKFRVDSSFGCIKLPTNCLLYDETKQLTYDLRKLYKKEGYRLNIGTKSIHFNLCGELIAEGPKDNDCNIGRAQVCEINGNLFINKGTNPSYEITTEHYIQARFTNGEICQNTETFSTIIHIKCSFKEEISFLSSDGCALNLLWLTPNACPKFETKTSGCFLSTPLGNIDLSSLNQQTDRIHEFSSENRLEYNICGNMHANCSDYPNATACYTTNGNQQIIGWGVPTLSYNDGNLRLEYNGEMCQRRHKRSSLVINFLCSYTESNEVIEVTKADECTFVLNMHSVEACLSREIVDCTYSNENVFYDLTPLISMQDNYKIHDTFDKNITYYLNICTTLLNGPKSFTFTNSMISMQNKSKPHILDTFSSLGKIARPRVKEGSLFIHSILGVSCEPGTDYSSIIHFQCSSNQGQPEFLRKTGCVYEFSWETQYACPKMKDRCDLDIDLPRDDIEIEMNPLGLKYIFRLCSEEYTKCINNSCSNRGLVQRPWKLLNDSLQIELNLDNPGKCGMSAHLETINITVYCDWTANFNIHKENIENCNVDIIVKTKHLCKNSKETVGEIYTGKESESRKNETSGETTDISVVSSKNASGILENTKYTMNMAKNQDSDNTKKEEQSISVQINNGNAKGIDNKTAVNVSDNSSNWKNFIHRCSKYKLRLENIKSSEIHAKSDYIINFDSNSKNCNGLICKNGLAILNFNDECPNVSSSETFVNLSYSLHGLCANNSLGHQIPSSFNISLLLRCGTTNQRQTSLKYEEDCRTEFESFSPELCNIVSDKGIKLTPFVLGIIIVCLCICIITYIIYKKNYCRKCSYTQVQGSEKTFVTHFKVP